MDGRLLPQFHIVLPINTPTHEVEVHARARLKGVLAQRFEVLTVKSVKTGRLMTKHGPVHGEQFLIVLRPIDASFESSINDDEEIEVLYEHPDFKKLIIH